MTQKEFNKIFDHIILKPATKEAVKTTTESVFTGKTHHL